MKLLVTTNARLYKTPDGTFWTQMVYNYDFFLRYLNVFDLVKLVAHVEHCKKEDISNFVRVDGPRLSVYEVPFPHGKIEYIKKYNEIRKSLKNCFQDCDAAILRIPDQLAFQVYPFLKRKKIPVGVEVTSNSWDLFSPGAVYSNLRPFLRLLWHFQQRHICKTAFGTAYVTKNAIQKRYPPLRALKDEGFTTNYTDTDINENLLCSPKSFEHNRQEFTAIHVSGSISGYAKGHKELIVALCLLSERNIKLNLVLVGAGELNQDIKLLIDNYKLKNRIRYTGLITNPDELRNELKIADIFIFPSYREGLPRVVIEAMSCALPCIATKLSGITELLEDDCLVPVKDALALLRKIEELVKNPSLLNQISKRNVEKAKEYSLQKMETKRSEFYQKIRNASL